ncbi:MAG: 2-oxoacid:acceptor oxidoreductase subunit alpha [Deltaproteobacteria bacterium]|nr:2-oxoacid:acceptor oxidoreductase subunit alpha [Deltaproteobacteria bacterium]MBW2564504.1 2-oxoacid:acceptor oxidoreductase subunit alpha [Deltaproteobacteria bacterium]
MTSQRVLTGEHFINGDEACTEGALAAGCNFFAGYPITPATEVAETMSRRLPKLDGTYVQMEDEIASIAAVLGAAWGGAKSMTSTSGPGFSLMMENIGLGVITETPCVIVNIQRGGPSTGLPTTCGQGDIMQAKWGSHGHYEIIAISPSSPQEMFDFTIRAFNLAETFRIPVLIMADEVVGHTLERVTIPPAEKIKVVNRKKPTESPTTYLPYKTDSSLIPVLPDAGDGYRIHITGLTHDERGYPVPDAETQEVLVTRLINKIRKNRDKIIDYEDYFLDGAKIIIVTYGSSVRPALKAMRGLRDEGVKVGLLKLNTIWPFAEDLIRKLAKKVEAFVVPEVNFGQIALEVERCASGQALTKLISHPGGGIHTPQQITNAVKKILPELGSKRKKR